MSLIAELQRRNVIRVAMAYVAIAWLAVQVLDTLAPLFGIGETVARLLVILLAIGLIPTLVISWLFELTPDGFRREQAGAAAPRTSTRKLDRLIIATLAIAVTYFAVDKFVFDPARDAEIALEAAERARSEALSDIASDKSVAVLPFVDMSPEGDQEYFSDGITEEIINLLARVNNLRVISRSSAFSFKGQNLPLADVADRLNVRYVLEGSVRRAGDSLRITAYMVDARTDTQLWSENFDRTFGDIFAIQDQVAAAVVDKLEIELAGGMPSSDVVHPEAYALYLRAKELLNRQSRAAMLQAEQVLEQSLALDGRQVSAWVLYSNLYAQKVAFNEMTWPEWSVKTLEAVENALAIDPDSIRARALYAYLSRGVRTTPESDAQAVAYAMSLDPLDPEFNRQVGGFLRLIGQAGRAVPYYTFTAERDPLTATSWRGLMLANFYAGRYEQALEANTRLRSIVGGSGGLWYRGMIHLMLDDPDSALPAFEGWAQEQPESAHAHHGLVLVNLKLGNDSEAAASLEKLEQTEQSAATLASAYAWLGRYDEAFSLLAEITESQQSGEALISDSPLYPGLSDDPRWQALLEKQGISDTQIEAFRLDELFPGPGLPPVIDVEAPGPTR